MKKDLLVISFILIVELQFLIMTKLVYNKFIKIEEQIKNIEITNKMYVEDIKQTCEFLGGQNEN